MKKFTAYKIHIGINIHNDYLLPALNDFFDIKIIKEMDIEESGFFLWKIIWFTIDNLKDVIFELKIVSGIKEKKNNRISQKSYHIGLHVKNLNILNAKHKKMQKNSKYSSLIKIDSLRTIDDFKYYYIIFNDELFIQIIDDSNFLSK